MTTTSLPIYCDDEERRALLQEDEILQGIDYIEVVTEPPPDNQRVLEVHFIPKTEGTDRSGLLALLDAVAEQDAVSITGGVRIPNVEVQSVERVDDHLEVRVSQPGDFSTYTLHVNPGSDPAFAVDPPYAKCAFSFKAGCPSRFDCKPPPAEPVDEREAPPIDYMAKDYASFRRALLDLIPQLVPDWQERHEADLGSALIELLAHLGDQLSYFQDAVANEAYLDTARQRISVRRHARLLDYHMHDGASARTFVHVALKKDTEDEEDELPKKTQVLSTIGSSLGSKAPPHGPEVPSALKAEALTAAEVVFETFDDVTLHADLNEITIHTWGNRACCLPVGTTSVDLESNLTAHLHEGDFLLLEEIKSLQTGLKADADPERRQIVRLTDVQKLNGAEGDALASEPLTRVRWAREDALAFPLHVSGTISSGRRKGEYEPQLSVARGNLVLADHGRTVSEWHPSDPTAASDPPGIDTGKRAYRFKLSEGPLSYRLPISASMAARSFFDVGENQMRRATPQVHVEEKRTDVEPIDWEAVPALFESDAFDRHFVVETDNNGRAVLRFGNDEFGMSPPDGEHMKAIYRVGVGLPGNVGADALTHVIPDESAPDWPDIKEVRNPLPAQGGTAPESMVQVKQVAPEAFHAEQFRAVTEEDYARMAERHPEVDKAVATFRWTGSWHTVFVTVDPVGQTKVPEPLREKIRNWVKRFTLAGYDLEITPPLYVPLDIKIDVCVHPGHFRADVEEALLRALSNRRLSGGRRGFFHPDRFTFGQSLFLSQLYAAVEEVEGVDSAEVTRFQRFATAPGGELEQGSIPMGRLEIVQLDNDPNFPERGVLELTMHGGK